MSARRALRARRVIALPDADAGPIVLDGAWVLTDGEVILAVGRDVDREAARVEDLGDVVLAPGLLNAHTHLELSHAPFLTGISSFATFMDHMRAYRASVDDAALAAAAAAGAREALATGTAAVFDLATTPLSARAVADSSLGGLVAAEVLGLSPERAGPAMERAREVLAAIPPKLRSGLFLHAPYSVSPELRVRARALARERRLRLAIHFLESKDEVALLTEGRGPMRDFIDGIGLGTHVAPPRALADVVASHAEEGMALVHLAAMPPSLATILPRGIVAVLCPRSNAALGVPVAPCEPLRRAGIPIALGTDSRASCPSLDMRAEMRAACDAYGIAPRDAFLMATTGGAAALGDHSLGRLAPGGCASLVAVRDVRRPDVYEAFIDASAGVTLVVVAGLDLEGAP